MYIKIRDKIKLLYNSGTKEVDCDMQRPPKH